MFGTSLHGLVDGALNLPVDSNSLVAVGRRLPSIAGGPDIFQFGTPVFPSTNILHGQIAYALRPP